VRVIGGIEEGEVATLALVTVKSGVKLINLGFLRGSYYTNNK